MAGGTSLFPSLRERAEREVGELAAQNAKVKVTSPANTMERRFSVWLGKCFLLHFLVLLLCAVLASVMVAECKGLRSHLALQLYMGFL